MRCQKCQIDVFTKESMYRIDNTGVCMYHTKDECEKDLNLKRAKSSRPGTPLNILRAEGWNLCILIYCLFT